MEDTESARHVGRVKWPMSKLVRMALKDRDAMLLLRESARAISLTPHSWCPFKRASPLVRALGDAVGLTVRSRTLEMSHIPRPCAQSLKQGTRAGPHP